MEYRNSVNKAITDFLKGLISFVEKLLACGYLISEGKISVPRQLAMVPVFLFFSFTAYSQSYRISAFNGQTVTTCSGIFYDSGGASTDYDNNENYTVTFCSGNGNAVKFDFTSLVIRTLDTLYVYDGPGTSSPLKAKYSNVLTTASLISSGTCMTFVFVSNGVFTRPGWEANISCCPPPVTSPVLPSDPYQCAGFHS